MRIKLVRIQWINRVFLSIIDCSSEKEQHLSAEWSSLVNKAYKILLSPIQRAEYILKSQNVEVPEANTASNSEFLMKMMERNEEVKFAEKSILLQLMCRNTPFNQNELNS